MAPDLELAARAYLRRLAGTDEVLRALYLQPDRAVYLAEQARIVLKVYADGTMLARERAVARRAYAAGIPVAAILGFAGGPPAVLAMRQVIGRPLTPETRIAALDAGSQIARFHRLDARPPFADGHRHWDAFVLARADRELAALRQLGVLAEEEVADLRGRFDRLRPRLVARPIALLHGDLQADHIIVDPEGERVIAFLDFADAQPGDPLLDIAILTLWEKRLTEPILEGYGGIDDDAETRQLLAHYRLLRLLGEVPWLLARGFADQAGRSLAAIREALREGAGEVSRPE